MSFDPAAGQGQIVDLGALIQQKQQAAAPAPAAPPTLPPPTGGQQPNEGIGTGAPVLVKSYVATVSGYVQPIDAPAAQAAITPAVDPAQAMKSPGGPAAPSVVQPGETTGGSDGSMVTVSQSNSGAGAISPGFGHPGAGDEG